MISENLSVEVTVAVGTLFLKRSVFVIKFPEGKRIVQIFSSTTFEEVVIMGTSYFIHTNNAVTHADRIYVMDLLEGGNGATFISEEEYHALKTDISSNYKLKSI